MRVGIIGYGTIGTDVAGFIQRGEAGEASLAAVLVRKGPTCESGLAGESGKPLFTASFNEFMEQAPDLVVECAGHSAVAAYGERVLRTADFMVVSAGALADEDLHGRLMKTARENGHRLVVPSAAIAGLDRIAAASVGYMEEVSLITRKPPKAWIGTFVEDKLNLEGLTEPVCVFEGPARESAKLFPESVNVSAALSLAGIGFDRTTVKVFVDPGITSNRHQVVARGKFGELQLEVGNTPSAANPKTGYIVAMSVIHNLRKLSGPFMIGL
ncbi:aspartate dehydrogenase [Paenibacillus apii]|uniref:aspartate dehydrogenase n=1 Tax=Paenibacillus apii TaxID=1850370 RepID=UPI00143A6C16|nr:aspartate dehydrogenase [Paenibacillus apii]NJJ39632.1 aspartate dehydrogenase [Paenibacillus apii]